MRWGSLSRFFRFSIDICDAVRAHLHQASALTIALTFKRNTFVSIAPFKPNLIISINNTSVTRMHSSRIYPIVLGGGGLCPGGLPGGVLCDLSYNAIDVTCMVFLRRLRLNSNAAAYIVLVMWPVKECWDTPPPPPGQNSILDTRLWKYYLPATIVAGGKNSIGFWADLKVSTLKLGVRTA